MLHQTHSALYTSTTGWTHNVKYEVCKHVSMKHIILHTEAYNSTHHSIIFGQDTGMRTGQPKHFKNVKHQVATSCFVEWHVENIHLHGVCEGLHAENYLIKH